MGQVRALMIPATISHDYGLGTAYERYHFYRLLDQWATKYGIESVLEGPVDGMAGVPGVHGVGLASRGVAVTSVVRSDAQATVSRAIYAGCGARADVRVMSDLADIETLPASDLVIAYHAISFVDDWPSYVQRLAKKAKKALVITVCNPQNWGVSALNWVTKARGITGMEPPDEWQTRTLAPVLWQLGQVKEHAYFDCPWWPDLQVSPGQTLKDRIGKLFTTKKSDVTFTSKGEGDVLAKKFVYGADRWPYFGGPGWEDELSKALRIHPSFETAPSAIRTRAAHLHGFLVETAPRTPQARRRTLPRVDAP